MPVFLLCPSLNNGLTHTEQAPGAEQASHQAIGRPGRKLFSVPRAPLAIAVLLQWALRAPYSVPPASRAQEAERREPESVWPQRRGLTEPRITTTDGGCGVRSGEAVMMLEASLCG